MEEVEAALARYDATLAECPLESPDPRIKMAARTGQCPECKSTSAGPCWKSVSAGYALAQDIRTIKALGQSPSGEQA